MAAGPAMRAALVGAGLWDTTDVRDPMTDPAAALAVRAAIVRRPGSWEPYYAEFRHGAGDSTTWVTHADLELAWKSLPALTICRNALLACLPGA